MIKNTSKFIFTLIAIFFYNSALADYPTTDLDFAFLPPYCKAKLKQTSDYGLWDKKLGPDFMHTHHFCASLHSLRVAKFMVPRNHEEHERKRYLLKDAVGEIDYMENHAKPNYVLFPYIYTTKAEGLLLQGKKKDAIEYFKKSIATNKKFKMAYVLLSDVYLADGEKSLAKELLEEGIKNIPNSKMIKKRLDKLK